MAVVFLLPGPPSYVASQQLPAVDATTAQHQKQQQQQQPSSSLPPSYDNVAADHSDKV